MTKPLVALRAPSIEAKPKIIHKARSYRDTVGLAKRVDLALELMALSKAIEGPGAVPERFYRRNRHQSDDQLLREGGIMHLHLGDREQESCCSSASRTTMSFS